MLAALLLLLLPAAGAKPEYQHGISLLHELKYPPDFTHFEYADPDAPKGGRIVLSTTGNIVNLSGQQGAEVANAPGLGHTIDRLFIRTGDELCGIYGWLARGVALSADRKTLTLRLHYTARWHDGEPITTRDVRYSYDELMKTVFGKVYLEPWVERLEINGPHDLAIHHRDVFTNANLAALVWFRIRPAHYWADRDPQKATLDPPVGSGPYRIREFDRGYIVYERVDDYWGRDLPIHRGRNNFDEIRYEVYRDATVAREGFRKGLFDIHFETDIRHWIDSYNIPALEKGWLLKETRRVTKFIGMQTAIAFNTDRERFRDVRVREALTVALDFEWQNRVFRHGSQQRALSYFASSQFAATGTPSGAELELLSHFRGQLPRRVFSEPFALPVSPGKGTIWNIRPSQLFETFDTPAGTIDQVYGGDTHRHRRWVVVPGIDPTAPSRIRSAPHGKILTGNVDPATIDPAHARTRCAGDEPCQFVVIIVAGMSGEFPHLLERAFIHERIDSFGNRELAALTLSGDPFRAAQLVRQGLAALDFFYFLLPGHDSSPYSAGRSVAGSQSVSPPCRACTEDS